MRLFIKRIIIFFYPIITIIGLIEIFINLTNINHLLNQNYKAEALEYKWINNIDIPSRKTLSIICGSSTMKYSLDCNEMNKSSDHTFYVNTAQDAGDPIRTYFILKSINHKAVNNVYLGLDPWIYTKYYYRHRNDIMYLDFSFFETLWFQRNHDSAALFKRYRGFFKFFLKPNAKKEVNEPPNDLGSGFITPTDKKVEDPCNWYNLNHHWSDIQFTYLSKIVELCARNHWNLTLVYPPRDLEYIRIMNKNCSFIQQEWNEKIESMHLKVTDLRKQINNSSGFNDGVHLNREGQVEFSRNFENSISF